MAEFGLIPPLEAGTTLAGASIRMMTMWWWSTIGIEAFSVENSLELGIVIGMRLIEFRVDGTNVRLPFHSLAEVAFDENRKEEKPWEVQHCSVAVAGPRTV